MKKYTVEEVKVGISKGGISCGPVSGNVVCELILRDEENKVSYYTLVEVDGTLSFFESMVSTYKGHMKENVESEEFETLLDEGFVDGFESYEEFYETVNRLLPLNNTNFIRKCLAYLVSAGWDETEVFSERIIGKVIGEFEIPIGELEAEYLDNAESEQ